MLIALFIVASFAALFFLLGVAIGRSGRKALLSEIQRLRESLAGALGELKQSEDKAEKMAKIAGAALDAAKERHFPNQHITEYTLQADDEQYHVEFVPAMNYHADPDPFRVENCPACL